MNTQNYGWWRKAGYMLFLLCIVIVYGCDRQGGTTNTVDDPTILDIIQSGSNLTVWEELVEGSTLSATFSGTSDKTLFAPSDAAFAKLPAGYLEGLNSFQKQELIKYHIYSGKFAITDEIKKESIPSVQGDPLFIETAQPFGNLINNTAKLTVINIKAANGLVHIIDEVLWPDQQGTLSDNISKRYTYRKFYDRIRAAELESYLGEAGSKTVLAVNDIGMESHESYLGVISENQWKEILQYHILDLDFTAYGPGTRAAVVTLSGDSIYLTVDAPGQYHINGGGGNPVRIINARNGKLVEADGIMLPDKYLGLLTIMDKRFNVQTARSALAAAKLTGRLYNVLGNGDEKFTIFIPKDDAGGLGDLPTGETELANILKYHILLEEKRDGQLEDNQTYTTWQGEAITITREGGKTMINGMAAIVQSDLIGKNGVVHIIDNLLIPPTGQ